jgi:hypothetical protein
LEFQIGESDLAMKCCNKPKPEVIRKAIEMAENYAAAEVEWIDERRGVVRVKPEIREAEILDYKVIETTSPYRQLLNDFKRTAVVRAKFGLLRRLLYKACYKEVPPKILFTVSPLYFENVKFHWSGLWFEGDIATKFQNNSEEGKQGVVWVRRRYPCPEDPEEYDWENVEGSASLLGNWLNKFWEDSTGTFISELWQELKERVDPRNYVTVSGHWKTDPLSLETFQTMWSIFTTGTIVTRHGFDVTVTYNFNGTQTKTYHVDLRVRLPIKGDISWLNW